MLLRVERNAFARADHRVFVRHDPEGPRCRSAKLVRDARPYRQSARTVLKISQTDRQPPGGMPPTCDSMDKGPGAFFARQTIENEANLLGLKSIGSGSFCF